MSSKKNYLKSLLCQVLKLLKFGIIPVYVFDGKKPEQKIITLERRRKRKENMKLKRDSYKTLLENVKEYCVNKKINIDSVNIVEKESIEVDVPITKVEDKKDISTNDDESYVQVENEPSAQRIDIDQPIKVLNISFGTP